MTSSADRDSSGRLGAAVRSPPVRRAERRAAARPTPSRTTRRPGLAARRSHTCPSAAALAADHGGGWTASAWARCLLAASVSDSIAGREMGAIGRGPGGPFASATAALVCAAATTPTTLIAANPPPNASAEHVAATAARSRPCRALTARAGAAPARTADRPEAPGEPRRRPDPPARARAVAARRGRRRAGPRRVGMSRHVRGRRRREPKLSTGRPRSGP